MADMNPVEIIDYDQRELQYAELHPATIYTRDEHAYIDFNGAWSDFSAWSATETKQLIAALEKALTYLEEK
jgi:hypothetical protein